MQTLDRMPRDSELAMSGGSTRERLEEAIRLWRQDWRVFMAVTALVALPLALAAGVADGTLRLLLGALPVFGGGLLAVALFAPTVCRRRRGLGHGLRHTVGVAWRSMPGLGIVAGATLCAAVGPALVTWAVSRAVDAPLWAALAALSGAVALGAWAGGRLLMSVPAMVAEELCMRLAVRRSLVMTRGHVLTVAPALVFAGGVVVLAATLPGWLGLSSLLLMPLFMAAFSLAAVMLACTYMWLRGD